ncbi:MAG: hypothetical protein ABIQ84_05015 [Usitatibacter sp.]
MRNFLSTAVITAALALGVPNNAAEAVGTTAEMMTKVAVTQPLMPSFTSMTTPSFVNTQSPDPTIAWLMAFGFLGLVIARRVRGE